MKPGFALSLSLEGLSLLVRGATHWHPVGKVDTDSADLDGELAALRAEAMALAGTAAITTKLILPNDQIRYLKLRTGQVDAGFRDRLVREALEGATPYDVDDLVYDISTDGPDTFVAAVARETLEEAETFAVEHDFNPVSFAAIPDDHAFRTEPFFGPTQLAATLLSSDDPVEPDTQPIIVQHRPFESADPAGIGVISGELPSEEGEGLSEEDAPSITGFSSRRRKTDDPTPRTKPEEAPVVAQPDLQDDVPQADPVVDQAAPSAEALPEAELQGDPVAEILSDAATADLPEVARQDASTPVAPGAVSDGPSEPPQLVSDPPPDAFAGRRDQAAPGATPKAEDLAATPGLKKATPEDEAARMTIFGARPSSERPRGRRPLGVVLALGVMAALAGVGAWAAFFRTDTPSSPQAIIEAEPSTETAAVPPEDLGRDVTDPALTDTDSAVLDALRSDEPASPQILDNDPRALVERYAETGIWPIAPDEPRPPSTSDTGDFRPTSLDRSDLAQDAVALADPADFATDQMLGTVLSPVSPDIAFDLDERGLVVPAAAGALSPSGILVFLGPPPERPPARPTALPQTAETIVEAGPQLPRIRPLPRPDDLAELNERQQLGGRTRQELATVRPRPRPDSAKQQQELDQTPTARAVAVSMLPAVRPSGLAARAAERAAQESRPAVPAGQQNLGSTAQVAAAAPATVAPRTVTPAVPSTASVARQATMNNAINLRRVNLIGVYGTAANRRALVRLPNGRYQKVKVGDRIDGGRVSAIGDSELRYQKGGRNLTLSMPSG